MVKRIETYVISVIIFFSSINIGYINFKFPWVGNLTFMLRIGLIILMLIYILLQKKRISVLFLTFSAYVIYVLIMTKINNLDIKEAIITLSMPYIILLTIENYKDNQHLKDVLKCWETLLMFLIALDWLSMVVFPGGLYATLYDNSWFLGYKTERLAFYLPFIILSAFLSELDKHKIDSYTYIYCFLCMASLLYSKATGALTSLVIIIVIFILINMGDKHDKSKKVLTFFLNFKVYITIYSIVLLQMFTIQSSKLMQFIVINVLHKDITFDTRAAIWESCFTLLKGKLFTGIGYLNYTQYQVFTHNIYATSAHNMLLTILITSGVIGVGFYLCFFGETAKKHNSSLDMICIAGIIAILVIGLTSSTIVYSTFSMLFFSMLTITLGGTNVRYKDSAIKK